jgi:hypothetical protein
MSDEYAQLIAALVEARREAQISLVEHEARKQVVQRFENKLYAYRFEHHIEWSQLNADVAAEREKP